MEENKEVKTFERKVIRISRKKLIVGIIILVVVLIAVRMSTRSIGIRSGSAINPTMMDSAMPTNGFGFFKQDSSYKDTREFMKTGYDSEIKTRDVSGIVRDVKNAVKGADGRIDSIYSSEKYGSIDFVVAKSKFDDFKDEIESLTHKKLYTETISSQNLLSEKQGIENNKTDTINTLEDLNNLLLYFKSLYKETIDTINKELNNTKSQLVLVRKNISNTTDSEILAALRNQETLLMQQESKQKKELATQDKLISEEIRKVNDQINNAKNNLSNVNEEDAKFTDNIETVNGSVRVEWVSLWALATIFSPIHPTIIIIILVVLGIICFRKRMPKVEIVK